MGSIDAARAAKAVKRLGAGLPPRLVNRLSSGEPILILEDAQNICTLIDDTYASPINYPFKTEFHISIYKDLVQLLPLHVLSLHAGAHKFYVECNGRTPFLHYIYCALERFNFGYPTAHRLYIVGNTNPSFILERDRDGYFYYENSARGWTARFW